MFCIGGAVSACQRHENDAEKKETPVNPELTIFIHHPKSGLEGALNSDLQEVNKALLKNPEIRQKVNILFFQNNDISGKLYKKIYRKDSNIGNEYIEDVLQKEYPLSQTDYTTFSGLHQILSDVISIGKTDKYGMVIGCHGSGWLPTKEDKSSRAASGNKVIRKSFGITSNDKYDTTYKTLGKAIEATGKKMEFLLVDDCYSQNIEVAYDLRNACKFLMGSVTEMGADGQDYETAIPRLFEGNYKAICDDNIRYYTQGTGKSWGTSTVSLVDCSQVEQMASIMKEIYISTNLNNVERSKPQVLDGYDCEIGYNIFYDFSQYIHLLCNDASLLAKFDAQMQKLIVYNVFTTEFNSYFFHEGHHHVMDANYLRPIKTCCGITCSDPCTEKQAEWKETDWYKATH